MKKYVSHKTVHAAKIKAVDNVSGATVGIHLDDGSTINVDVPFIRKHDPKPGGYYVVYSDGYASYSPAKAFEEGYAECETPLEEVATPDEKNFLEPEVSAHTESPEVSDHLHPEPAVEPPAETGYDQKE